MENFVPFELSAILTNSGKIEMLILVLAGK